MPKRVLVIEDSRDIAELLSLHLEDLGCEVTLADDGLLGYEEARSGRYDLIILDLMLPGMDGIEICRRLRAKIEHDPADPRFLLTVWGVGYKFNDRLGD